MQTENIPVNGPVLADGRNNKTPVWLLVVFVSMILSGGGVYWWQQAKINELGSRPALRCFDQESTKPELTTTPEVKPTTDDGRTALTMEEWRTMERAEMKPGFDCNQYFGTKFAAEANTKVIYKDEKYSYSVELPYNETWGDEKYKVVPYEVVNTQVGRSVFYGKPFSTEGCEYIRVEIVESQPDNIDSLITKIENDNKALEKANKANNAPDGDGMSTYKKLTGYKYPVLEISTANAMFGNIVSHVVFLPKVNLEFTDTFGVHTKDFSEIVSSIKSL